MRDDHSSKKSKFLWTKTLVKKLFNIKSKTVDYHVTNALSGDDDEEWIGSFSGKPAKKTKSERSSRRRVKMDADTSQFIDLNNYRIFVATWNVAGKSPSSFLNLDDWLHTSPPADIYVLGFQEIVPLNAGNVLGTEDNGPARKWLSLIQRTLNNLPGTSYGNTPSPFPDPIAELDADFEGSARQQDQNTSSSSSFFTRPSFQSRSLRLDNCTSHPQLDRRFSVCERDDFNSRFGWDSSSEEDNDGVPNVSPSCYNVPFCASSMEENYRQGEYCLVASKQMVGIFLTVWIKSDLGDGIKNMKVSCVGRGLMGYLGNKGSISISMCLYQTSFCFVCSHLTSGQKDGDELRRNSDVMEILRKTRFPRVTRDDVSPQTILEHDRVIWLGDLNYRIALPYRSARALLEMRNWRVLLKNDQLRIEQREGRVFEGWNEGKINFPPTYKYSNNSDRYSGEDTRPKKKKRTPAWCDRILWHGRGLYQESYVRGESRFSDHRPVYSVFSAEVECLNRGRIRKGTACSGSRIEVEELLPQFHGYSDLCYYY